MFKIQFSSVNAAFDEDPRAEIAAILKGIADDFAHGWRAGKVFGNRIGSWDAEAA